MGCQALRGCLVPRWDSGYHHMLLRVSVHFGVGLMGLLPWSPEPDLQGAGSILCKTVRNESKGSHYRQRAGESARRQGRWRVLCYRDWVAHIPKE